MTTEPVLSFNRQATFEVTRLSHDFGPGLETVHVELTCKAGQGPHKPDFDTWAVRWMGRCWSALGEWEWEPIPSERTDEFLWRTRWPREAAIRRAREAIQALSDDNERTSR